MELVTQTEFETLIADSTKRIDGSIAWEPSGRSGLRFEFRVRVTNESGDSLTVKGSHNRMLGKTSYTLFTNERIFAVDYDRTHGDVGSFHVGTHLLTRRKLKERTRRQRLVETPSVYGNALVLKLNIQHDGSLAPPPPVQRTLDLK